MQISPLQENHLICIREKRDPPTGGGEVMEGWRGNRRRGGKEARRWDRRRGERRGDDDKEMGVKKEEEMGGKE